MSKRKPLPKKLINEILKKFNYSCIKCGGHYDVAGQFDVHHINHVIDGGEDDIDNLVLLCHRCHREWHYLVNTKAISFRDWLNYPPFLHILYFLHKRDVIPPGSDFHEIINAFFQTFQNKKEYEIFSYEPKTKKKKAPNSQNNSSLS